MTTKIRKAVVSAGASALIAGALLSGAASGAFAATLAPTVNPAQTIAKGSTGKVGATIMNQLGTAQTGDVTLTLQAPSNSIFVLNEVWGSTIIQGVQNSGTSKIFSGCTISNAGKTMNCSGPVTIPAAGNGAQSGVNFITDVQAQASAADDTLYTDGAFIMGNSTNLAISGGTTNLQFRTPAAVSTPMVDPVIGGGAAAASLLTIGGIYLARARKNSAIA